MSTQLDRIQFIEKQMERICEISNLGGYNILTETLITLKKITDDSSVPALSFSPMLQPFFDEKAFLAIANMGFTQDDITIINERRGAARQLLRESLILLFTNSKKVLSGSQARDTINDLAKQSTVTMPYLNAAEADKIRSGNILNIDTTWILNQLNLDCLTLLVKRSNLTIEAAFDFYDTLSHPEKTALTTLQSAASTYIQQRAAALANLHLSLDEEIAEINRFYLNESLKFSHLVMNETVKNLDQKFIRIFFTPAIRDEISLNAIRRHLNLHLQRYTQTAAAQPPAIAKQLIANFKQWIVCRLDNYCPPKIPAFPAITEERKPAKETLSTTLASVLTSEPELNLNNVSEYINMIAKDPNTKKFFQYPIFDQFIPDLNNTDIGALFTPAFKTQLANDITAKLSYFDVLESIVELNRDILYSPIVKAINYVNALQTAVSCFFVKETLPLISDACQSVWSKAPSLSSTVSHAITALPTETSSVSIYDEPTNSYASNVIIDTITNPAMQPVLLLGMMGCAFAGASLAKFCFFSKKHQSANVTASDKKALLPHHKV